MANEPTTYRARPLTDGLITRLRGLFDQQRVVVEAKNVMKSATMIINGALLVAAITIQLLDIIFGANIIEPIVKVFTTDPEVATKVITVMTQIYTVLNIALRLKTTSPVTLKSDKKE